MKLDPIRLGHMPLNGPVTVALLIADATQNIRSPEERAAGAMLFLQTYLDALGEDPQDVATVVQNMRHKAENVQKGRIAALAEFIKDEMLKVRTADDILDEQEF
ncbi:tellurite resistance protein [Rhizobium ruizarguesonis]